MISLRLTEAKEIIETTRGGKSTGTWEPNSQTFLGEKIFAESFAEKNLRIETMMTSICNTIGINLAENLLTSFPNSFDWASNRTNHSFQSKWLFCLFFMPSY